MEDNATTGISSIVVRFYDEQKNNISNEVQEIVQNGFYDSVQQGIIMNLSELNLVYKKGTKISHFQIGFKVEKNNYFSKFMGELLREYIRDMY